MHKEKVKTYSGLNLMENRRVLACKGATQNAPKTASLRGILKNASVDKDTYYKHLESKYL